MKNYTHYKRSLFGLCMIIVFSSFGQQQFIHTASKENISCNYDCTVLDVTGLNDNPAAILFVTPVLEKGINSNPHPIGAYYFKSKWHIFNLDGRPISVNAKFTVKYFTKADSSHFQYSFNREDVQADGSAFIDHPLLNNNPTVKFTHFLSWDPNSQGGTTNREEITVHYNTDAGKWSVTNNNKKPLFPKAAYNISIEAAGNKTSSPPIVTDKVALPVVQLIVPVNPAGGLSDIGFMFMAAWAGTTKLPGDNKQAPYLEYTELWGLEMGTNNFSARKSTYDPITIRLRSGTAMMIHLLNAYISKQSMTLEIDALSNSATGKMALNYTIKLTGVTINHYKQVLLIEPSQAGSTVSLSKKSYDEIKVSFTQIQFTNSTGATATDNF